MSKILLIIKFLVGLLSRAKKYLGYVDEAIEVVQAIKKALESDAAIRLTELIPGGWDNLLRVRLTYALTKASVLLGRVAECEAQTGEAKIVCYLTWLKLQPSEIKAMNYARICLMVARELMESFELSDAELNAVIQTRYVQRKKDKEDTTIQ